MEQTGQSGSVRFYAFGTFWILSLVGGVFFYEDLDAAGDGDGYDGAE